MALTIKTFADSKEKRNTVYKITPSNIELQHHYSVLEIPRYFEERKITWAAALKES